jgi:hypothetical protein
MALVLYGQLESARAIIIEYSSAFSSRYQGD